MKKLFFLGALFAVGLGFTACSSDKDVVADDVTPNDNATGTNYIAISISLPFEQPSVTRSAATDNNGDVTYDDGLAAEYAVNDATLVIFDKSTKNFKAAYNLGLTTANFETVSTSNNVTETSTKKVLHVSNSVAAGDFALVILNKNGVFTLSGNNVQFTSGTDFSGDFAAFQAKTATATEAQAQANNAAAPLVTNGFFMANAILADKQGSTITPHTDVKIQTLVPITSVYKTEKEAQDGAATEIYVERAVAKVTINGEAKNFTTSTVGGAALGYTIAGWTLDNTNPVSYIVRSENNFLTSYAQLKSQETGQVYRCYGNTNINYPTVPEYLYRTYFSECANFNHETALLRIAAAPTFKAEKGLTNPLYCFENTFTVANQIKKYTTLVWLKVTAGDGSTDYYTLGGNKTKILTSDLLQTALQTAAYNYLLSTGAIDIAAAGAASVTTASTDLTITIETSPTDVEDVQITGVTASTNSTYYTIPSGFASTLMGEVGKIVLYDDGASYYPVLIKHFGDNLTPWSTWEANQSLTAPRTPTSTETTQAAKIAAIYPTNNSNQAGDYLGRYGVLRNNWYNININSIRYLGDAKPKVDNWPDDPDDEFDSFIAYQINVLSWAKRPTQIADL